MYFTRSKVSMNDKRIEAAKRALVRQRNYRRARDRALTRLGRKYPDVYEKLYKQEKKALEKEGKVWVDIDGNTLPSMGDTSE